MTTDISKANALRKLAKSDRDHLLSTLDSAELETLSKLLLDDPDEWSRVGDLEDTTTMKKVLYHLRADRLDLYECVRSLKESPDGTGNISMLNMGVGGIGVPNTSPTGNSSGLTYEGDPLILKNALIDWKQAWRDISVSMAMKCVKVAVENRAKPALMELMDANVLTAELSEIVEFRQAGKVYLKGEYDKQRVRPADVMLKARSVSVYDALIEHPIGAQLIKTAKNESCYTTLNYLFDTFKTDTLIGLLDKGLDPNIKEPDSGRPFICNVSYKASADDVPVLEAMVQHGLNIRTVDEMGTTPLMQGVKQGLIDFVKFLLVQPNVDLYAANSFKDTILTLAMEGPNRFEERYAEYLLRVESSKEYYAEVVSEWEEQVQHLKLEASEKGVILKDADLPPKPDEKDYTPTKPVEEYPMELMGIIQDSWNAGDPTTSEQYLQGLAHKEDPMHKLADSVMKELGDDFEFSVNF